METITDLIMSILSLAIQLVIVLAGGALVRWLRARYSAEQIAVASQVMAIAVDAVEQMAVAGNSRLKGRLKLEKAVDYAQELLATRGIRVQREHLQTLAEAAVREMQAVGRELKRPGGPPAA